MTFRPVPKPTKKRRVPTRKKRGQFSKETAQAIIDRDDGLCRVCKRLGEQIHHVMPKGRGGRGTFTNGVYVCQSCHAEIHRDNDKLDHWIKQFRIMYGNDFYKDEWDEE